MSGFALEKKSSNDGIKNDWPKGVFIDVIKISSATNSPVEWNDCNILVEGDDVTGKSKYPKKFYLGGKHKKDGKKCVDWGDTAGGVQGGSWKVRDFLVDAGVEKSSNMINEDGSLTDAVLADLHGREVVMLQYESNGKYSRETWFYFESASNANAIKDLISKWNGYDDKPNKYLHQIKTEVQNKKLNKMWEELPDNNKSITNELDDMLS
tara:strand:- start:21857 stop:22483 length:627 start_codon:yes stop_codon:yes gene_type:complete